jgi:prevent-host-death family protein
MGERAIDLGEAQSQLRDLAREAARGEEVILTEGGEPIAKIIPITRARSRRHFGSARGLIHLADDFDAPLDEFNDYM